MSAFYLLAFSLTWLAWLPQTAHSHGLPPFTSPWFNSPAFYMLGGLGPGVAAFVLARLLHGPEGEQRLWASVLRWRVGVRWYAAAVLVSSGLWLGAAGASGGDLTALVGFEPWVSLLPTLALYLVAAVPEEVGWRGFALPHLQVRHGALVSSLLVGSLWALWHLPLLLHAENPMSSSRRLPWTLATVAAAVVYTWMFNSTGGSIAVVTVLHAFSNAFGVQARETAGDVVGAEAAIVPFVAVGLVMVLGPAHLARRPRIRWGAPREARIPAPRGE